MTASTRRVLIFASLVTALLALEEACRANARLDREETCLCLVTQ